MTYVKLMKTLLKRKEFLKEQIGEQILIYTHPDNSHRVKLEACTKRFQYEERLVELQWVISLLETKIASAAAAEKIRSGIEQIIAKEDDNPYPPEEGGDKDG